MQRVAIARALVHDPDILLADEPTGALDSETSVQVMDLLKEVAQDRLVVMVTHNPELAEQDATRIVRLKDGRITDDTDPYDPEAESAPVHRNLGRASMSARTALSLSFHNLWTKKVRTLLVAFAGSIGIIGIAMILSMSNGANRYIQSVQEEALQDYPLTVTDTVETPQEREFAFVFILHPDVEVAFDESHTRAVLTNADVKAEALFPFPAEALPGTGFVDFRKVPLKRIVMRRRSPSGEFRTQFRVLG